MIKPIYNYIPVNEEINYNPLVLCYRLFVPVKHKTYAIGLWKDATGRIYRDNIHIETISLIHKEYFNALKRSLFNSGEKAVFYKNPFNEGVIENAVGNKTILKIRREVKLKHLKAYHTKTLLNANSGLTIYRIKDGYLIEMYK